MRIVWICTPECLYKLCVDVCKTVRKWAPRNQVYASHSICRWEKMSSYCLYCQSLELNSIVLRCACLCVCRKPQPTSTSFAWPINLFWWHDDAVKILASFLSHHLYLPLPAYFGCYAPTSSQILHEFQLFSFAFISIIASWFGITRNGIYH